MERLSLLLEAGGLTPAAPRPVAVIPVGEAAEGPALDVAAGAARAPASRRRSPTAAISSAAWSGRTAPARARRCIIGDAELEAGVAQLRDLDAGTQEAVPLAEVPGRLR